MTFEFFPSAAVIAQIGPLKLHFYGAMYALAAVCGYFLLAFLARRKDLRFPRETLLDFVFWAFLGGILGGRIFYVLIYNFPYFRDNPGEILAVWNGGMSIHGGLLGGALGALIFLRRKHLPVWPIAAIVTPALALGMMFGRIGNFVNGELVGRVTEMPWALQSSDGEWRHPAQLYAAAKDFFLFLLFLFLNLRTKLSGKILFGLFLIFYGILRFSVEFFREPDPQIGLLWNTFSLGQLLSVVVIIVGILIVSLPPPHKKKKS